MTRRFVRFGVCGSGRSADTPCVKQIRIQRRTRRSGGNGDPIAELPVVAVSDTSAAARVLASIDAIVD